MIAFTDDDCQCGRHWLEHLVGALRASPAEVAGVGGRVLPDGPGLIADYMTRHRILEPPPTLDYLVTANCIYRRDALRQVGGFDERVRTPGGEDPGLSFALEARGYRFGFEPRAIVRHRYRENVRDFVRTFYRYGRGAPVSWVDVLKPSRPTPVNLALDLAGCWREYAAAEVPLRRRFLFLGLRGLQRVACSAGWRAGRRVVAAHVRSSHGTEHRSTRDRV